MNKIKVSFFIFIIFQLVGCLVADKEITATDTQGNQTKLTLNTVALNLARPINITLANSRPIISNLGKTTVGETNNTLQFQGYLSNGSRKILDNLESPNGLAILDKGRYALLANKSQIQLIDLINSSIVNTNSTRFASFTSAVTVAPDTALFVDSKTGFIFKAVVNNLSINVSVFLSPFQLGGRSTNAMAFNPSSNVLYFISQGSIFQTSLNSNSEVVGNIEEWLLPNLPSTNFNSIASMNENAILVSVASGALNPGSVYLFDAINQTLLSTISGEDFSPNGIAYEQNNQRLFLIQSNNTASSIDISPIIN